jgi:hypothetical protein
MISTQIIFSGKKWENHILPGACPIKPQKFRIPKMIKFIGRKKIRRFK